MCKIPPDRMLLLNALSIFYKSKPRPHTAHSGPPSVKKSWPHLKMLKRTDFERSLAAPENARRDIRLVLGLEPHDLALWCVFRNGFRRSTKKATRPRSPVKAPAGQPKVFLRVSSRITTHLKAKNRARMRHSVNQANKFHARVRLIVAVIFPKRVTDVSYISCILVNCISPMLVCVATKMNLIQLNNSAGGSKLASMLRHS